MLLWMILYIWLPLKAEVMILSSFSYYEIEYHYDFMSLA